MAENQRPEWRPFDEKKLFLVREFLRREFRDFDHRDFVVFDPPAQVFVVTKRGVEHTLVIPKATFELAVAEFAVLCETQLVDALQHARGGRVTMTPDGLDVSL
jgi:hypothetical protein